MRSSLDWRKANHPSRHEQDFSPTHLRSGAVYVDVDLVRCIWWSEHPCPCQGVCADRPSNSNLLTACQRRLVVLCGTVDHRSHARNFHSADQHTHSHADRGNPCMPTLANYIILCVMAVGQTRKTPTKMNTFTPHLDCVLRT